MLLTPVSTQRYDIGRAAVFRQPVWDGTTNLFENFVHIGNTEGAIDIAPNPEYSELTLPETSGPAPIKRYFSGERPEFELAIFPTEASLALFTPVARGSSGLGRRRTAREHTLWIVPEELFLKADVDGNMIEVPVTYSGGAFLKDGLALTAEEQRLVDLSMVIWRADISRSTPLYRHEDGGKSLRSVTVRVQQDFSKPDGSQLYLIVGEAADFPSLYFDPSLAPGAEGVNFIVVGGSYFTNRGIVGDAPFTRMSEMILEALPDDPALFTLTDRAISARGMDSVNSNFATDVVPFLSMTRPNVIAGFSAGELNSWFFDGVTTVAAILTKVAAFKALCDARPESHLNGGPGIYVAAYSQWSFPDVPINDPADAIVWNDDMRGQINAAYAADVAGLYHEPGLYIDLTDYLPTAHDEEATPFAGAPADRTLYEGLGNKNHPTSLLSRNLADILLVRVKATLLPGLPIEFPDGYRIETENPDAPTSIEVYKGTRSRIITFIPQLDGVDMDGRYRMAVENDARELLVDFTAYDDGGTDNWIQGTPDGGNPPNPNEFTLFASSGSGTTLRLAYGETYGENLGVTWGAGIAVDKPWLMFLRYNVEISAANTGVTTAQKQAKAVFTNEPTFNQVRSGSDVTTWTDPWTGMVFSGLVGTPSIVNETVNGRSLDTLVLAAGEELLTPYGTFVQLGDVASAAFACAVSFADGAGGSISIETASGEYFRISGGATNILIGAAVIQTPDADFNTPVPRVASGGNSWRAIYAKLHCPDAGSTVLSGKIAGITAAGTLPTSRGAVTLANARVAIRGPIRVRGLQVVSFNIDELELNDGTGVYLLGANDIGNARLGTTSAA